MGCRDFFLESWIKEQDQNISLSSLYRVLVQNVEALFERGFFGEMGTKGRVGHCDTIYVLTLGQTSPGTGQDLVCHKPKKMKP